MFKLFKRKNEMKELKCRLEVLEAEVITLKAQKEKAIDFSKSWGDEFNLKGCTFNGGLIKNSKFSADKVSCGNCNKEAIVPLENTEFTDKLNNIQDKCMTKHYIKENFKGLDSYKMLKK